MGYFLVLTLIAIVFSFNKNNKLNQNIAFFIILSMILLSGLRDVSVGRDTINYYSMYTNPQVSGRIEPLFKLLVISCKSLGFTYNGFLMIVSLLIYLPLYFFIKKWSVNPCFSVLIYITFSAFFFSNSFNVLRNAIAGSFVLHAIGFYGENKYKKTLFVSLLSVGFHYSSLIALPLILLAKKIKGIKPVQACVILCLSMVIGLSSTFYDNVFTMVLQQLPILTGDAVDNYYGFMSDVAVTKVNTNGIIMLIAPVTLVSFLSFNDKFIDKYLRVVLFVGVVLGNLFVSVLYSYRLTIYFTLLLLLIAPLLKSSHVKYVRYSMICIALVMASYFILNLVLGNNANLLPYKFFFER